MADYNFTGGVDSDWATNGNWDIAGWPTAGDTATFGAGDICDLNDVITIASLVINGAGAVLSLYANLTITTGVTLTSGTLDMGSATLTVASNWISNAAGFTQIHGTSILVLSSANPAILTKAGNEFYNLTFNVDGFTVSNFIVNNDLTIIGTFNLNDRDVEVGGNIGGAGTLRVSPGGLVETITLSGNLTISTLNMNGEGTFEIVDAGKESLIDQAYTFENFKCIIPGKVIKFKESISITVNGIFTIDGAVGNLIELRSQSEGTQWGIDNVGNAESVDFAFVKDGSPVGSNDITTTNSEDGGNNDITTSPKWLGLLIIHRGTSADGVKFGDAATVVRRVPSTSPDGVKFGDAATVESFRLKGQDGIQLRLYSPTEELLAILSDTDKSGSILDVTVKVLKIGGVDKFSFNLNRNVDVPITRNTKCYFYANRELWFIGYVKETPSPDQSEPVLKIEGEGFVKRLLKKTITGGSYGPDTLENIIKSIANTELGDEVGVFYDVAKIAAPVVAGITIQFKDKNLFQIFTTLLEICNYDYDNAKYRFYIDTEQYLVFELLNEDLQNNLFEGYQFQQPEVSLDNSKIINKIFAFRTKVASAKEVEYVSTYDDLISQGKYGLFVKKITFPDYADTATIEKMCDFILQRRADPQDKVEIENYEVNALVPFGKYGISNRRDLYWKVAMACDTLDGWNVANLDDTTLELSSIHVLTGRQSMKFTTAIGSLNEYAEYTFPGDLSIPLPSIVRVFAYFENVACQIKVSFFDEDGSQADIDFASIFTDQWLKYSKEILGESVEEDLLVDKLGDPDLDLHVDMDGEPDLDLWVRDEISPKLFAVKRIRVTILEDVVATFYIDLFDVFANIYNYHELQVEELEYHLSSIGAFANINFGEVQDSVIDEIKGQVKEGNIALDIFSKQ